jgi:NAD(P)-dependent dehydrogenase (short-subunit alcohol dehydrogenase family)
MLERALDGKVAFITGGTSGIGLCTARAFAQAGAAVMLAARDEAAGRAACVALEATGARAGFVRTDVREDASLARAVAHCVERFGKLDVAFNCAGAGGDMAPLERADQNVWDDVMATNARGTWLSMRREIPALLAAGGGAIVNMSSIYGTAGRAAHHAYVASKHAVLGMTRSLALEYAQRNIRINAVCAGITATLGVRAAQSAAPELVQGLISEHPIGRAAEESEIAASVLWLCSAAASYITGAAIPVDGGFSAA